MQCSIREPRAVRVFQKVLTTLRQISEDVRIEFTKDYLGLRALSSTKSALPFVKFNRSFFHSFTTTNEQNEVSYQIQIAYLRAAFKNVKMPTHIDLQLDTKQQTLTVISESNQSILHRWVLFVQESSIYQVAVYSKDGIANIKYRSDALTGLSKIFKATDVIEMELQQVGSKLALGISNTKDSDVESLLLVHECDKLEIESPDNEKEKLQIASKDFYVALKLASIFSHKAEIQFHMPGSPMVVTTSMNQKADVEVIIATGFDEQQSEPPSTCPSPPSIINTKDEKPQDTEQKPDQASNILLLAKRFCSETPPFNAKRKNFEEFVEDSQVCD